MKLKIKSALLLAGIVIILIVVQDSVLNGNFQITFPNLKLFQTSVLPKVNSSLRAKNNLIHYYSTDRKWTDKYPQSVILTGDISSTSASIISQQLSLSDTFHFPHPRASKVADIIAKYSWIQELQSILEDWKQERQVVMVVSNSAYQEVLLNWLLSAALVIPLNQILIIALDEPVWRLMHNRGFQSVLVPPSSLTQRSRDITLFGQIMLTRLSVMRLLNHWGFCVAMIDTDALLLKDPWPLFEKYPDGSIVASQGKFPSELSAKWGTALCVGVILIRSSNQTGMGIFIRIDSYVYLCLYIPVLIFHAIEDFWKVIAEIQPKSFSDQGRTNYGLEALQAKWQRLNDGTFEGGCANGLKVNTLSYSRVCRSNCNKNKLSLYYVWHRSASRDGKSKMKAAAHGDIWLVSPQWNSTCENSYLKQHMWLKCIHA